MSQTRLHAAYMNVRVEEETFDGRVRYVVLKGEDRVCLFSSLRDALTLYEKLVTKARK